MSIRTLKNFMNTQNLEKSKMENNNKVYEDLLDHVMHLLNDHQKPVELVAGSMMAIAQRLYKTLWMWLETLP